MKIYGNVDIGQGGEIINAVIASGTSDASNPDAGELFYRSDLHAMRVYNGSTWHTTAMTDVPQTLTAGFGIEFSTLTNASGTVALNANLSNNFLLTLTQNVSTLTITNAMDGQTIQVVFIQDGTGGWTVAWPGNFSFLGNTVVDPSPSSYTVLTATYSTSLSGWIAILDENSTPGSGTVTSVALADGSTSPIYSVSGSPVTSSGTLTFTLATQTANRVFAGPSTGSPAQPAFRSLVAADIPSLAYVTSVAVSGSNGIGVSGSPITSSGTITLSLGAITPTTVNGLALTAQANGFTIAGGTTSKTLIVPLDATVSGSNTGDQTITLTGDVTGSGTGSFATTLATVNSNTGSFGDASHVGAFTVNGKGLITAASSTAIAIASSAVSGLAASATTDTTNASNISSGTLPSGRLSGAYTGITGLGAQTQALNMNSNLINNVTTPVSSGDAANKSYVDSVAAGMTPKASVMAATTANLTATASGSGVGKTLTNSGTQAAFAVDGYTASASDRILVKNQSTGANNGIYTVTTVGSGSSNWVLTRATDFDGSPASEVASGDTVFVENGTVNDSTFWVLTTNDPITVDTTALAFTQFGGPGTYSAGTGLTLTGTVFAISSSYLGANPTASVGLTAVNGTATTYMRSDAAPALDQSISPTWSGSHTFSNEVTMNSGLLVNGTEATYTPGQIVAQSNTNRAALAAANTSTTGTNNTTEVRLFAYDGSGITTVAQIIGTDSNFASFPSVLRLNASRAAGQIQLQTNATTHLTVNSAGNTFFQASGTAITSVLLGPKTPIVQVVGDSANNENNPGSINIITPGVSGAGGTTRGANLYLTGSRATNANLQAGTYVAVQANDILGSIMFAGDNSVSIRNIGAQINGTASSTWSATNSEGGLTFFTTPNASTTPTSRMTISSSGTVTINTPTSGLGLTISGGGASITGSLTLASNTAKAFLYSDASSNVAATAAPTNGQLLIGSTGNIPAVAALTQGTGVTITNGAGTITVANAGVLSIAVGATSTTTGLSTSGSTGALTLSGVAFTSSNQGMAPASGGGTTNFLRADGTWAAPVTSVTLTSTQIAFGNGSNVLTSSSNITWDDTSAQTLKLGTTTTGATITGTTGSSTGPTMTVKGAAGTAAGGGTVIVQGGTGAGTGSSGGNVQILGGVGGGSHNGSAITITAGAAGTASTGGSVTMSAGTGGTTSPGGALNFNGGVSTSGTNSTGVAGAIVFSTGVTSLVERFRIFSTGDWSIGSAGNNVGTSGQVLASGGSGAAPAWSSTPTISGSGITAVASITATNSTTNTAFDVPFLSAATGTVTILSNAGLTFNPSTQVFTHGTAATGPSITATAGTTAGTTFAITGSAAGAATNAGGSINITAGANNGAAAGGSITIATGTAASGTGGTITFKTGTTASTTAMTIASTGAITVAAPTSGTALTVNSVSGGTAANFIASTAFDIIGLHGSATNGNGFRFRDDANGADRGYIGYGANTITGAAISDFCITSAAGILRLGYNSGSNTAMTISTAGAIAITAPSSGVALSATAVSGQPVLSLTTVTNNHVIDMTDGTVSGQIVFASAHMQMGTSSSHQLDFYTGGSTKMSITSAGNTTHSAPSSGITLTVNGVSGTHSTQIADSAAAVFNAGFLETPIVGKTASYTLVLADSGKSIYLTGSTAAQTVTVPANASVAYPVGTTITIINDASVSWSIAITTDTMVLAGAGSTGTRTLAAFGIATLVKVTSTRWYINGTNLT